MKIVDDSTWASDFPGDKSGSYDLARSREGGREAGEEVTRGGARASRTRPVRRVDRGAQRRRSPQTQSARAGLARPGRCAAYQRRAQGATSSAPLARKTDRSTTCARASPKAKILIRTGRIDEAIARCSISSSTRSSTVRETTKGSRGALSPRPCARARGRYRRRARVFPTRRSPRARGSNDGPYARRAVRRLVEIAHRDRRATTRAMDDREGVPARRAPEETRGEIALPPRPRRRRPRAIPTARSPRTRRSPQTSRFWSQATYLSGLIQVERGNSRRREPVLQGRGPEAAGSRPRRSSPTSGSSPCAISRASRSVASRTSSSASTTRATTTTSCRATRIASPRRSTKRRRRATRRRTTKARASSSTSSRACKIAPRYEDEARILDAYIDLALCKFRRRRREALAFLARVRARCATPRAACGQSERGMQRAARLRRAPAAMRRRRSAARLGHAGVAARGRRARARRSRVRRDRAEARRARARGERPPPRDRHARRHAAQPRDDRRRAPRASTRTAIRREARRRARRRSTACAADRRARAGDGAARDADRAAEEELAELEARAQRRARRATTARRDAVAKHGRQDLPDLLRADAAQVATTLTASASRRRATELARAETALAKDALRRARSAPLAPPPPRAARAHRVGAREEARARGRDRSDQRRLSSRRTRIDSLDAARFLRDNEEYWPFEGDDWPDEFVGTEGLK